LVRLAAKLSLQATPRDGCCLQRFLFVVRGLELYGCAGPAIGLE